VASNFASTLSVLADTFTQQTGTPITLITGSTGKMYAQIMHGAPFDLFFAADRQRPEKLVHDGLVTSAAPFTYAIGRLVLWSPDHEPQALLTSNAFRYLAIANPKLAPYGAAAQQVLVKTKQWQVLQSKLVRGENIAQAFQYVKTGNADLGFIALTQIYDAMLEQDQHYWIVPEDWYEPIEQQVVQLSERVEATQFIQFMQSEQARQIIKQHGYRLP
jgi:molybdate transport system substrate-binding protein